MLSILNAHPRDKRISFEEANHKYFVNGNSDYTSVTTVIKKFFGEFDADKVIEKMKISGSFEKKYGDKTSEQVKDEWKTTGSEASARGTKLHKYIENFYNGIEDDAGEDLVAESNMFYNFLQQVNLKPYRTEWYVFDEETKIAGSIDMVFQLGEKTVAIYDWKCSKEIKTYNRYGNGAGPLRHLSDCNGNHYSLQLNMYKYILEKNYGLKVVDMQLVVLHKTHEDYSLVKIGDMSREIQAICKMKRLETS
jgi:ATP-dependent exoDNAse (exonuclease V) beta subunit